VDLLEEVQLVKP